MRQSLCKGWKCKRDKGVGWNNLPTLSPLTRIEMQDNGYWEKYGRK